MIYLARLQKIAERFSEIERELHDPEVVKDPGRYQKLMKEAARLRPIVEAFRDFQGLEKEEEETAKGLAAPGLDPEMRKLYEDERASLAERKKKRQSEIEELLLRDSEEHADRDVMVEIRAGTGGEEAALFAADLYRMYTKYAAEKGFQYEVMASNPTGKGGFKELIFAVSGPRVYPAFKYESGIHRVQRVPETEASGRIHTSAVTVAVLLEADETEIEIDPGDLRIDVYRASGAGGQHVNKTESAVRITHLPTGFVVSCQDERSQHKNKLKAMRVLRARLYEMKQEQQHKAMAEVRKSQVGSGDRSGKIRTYNFLDRRVTDHRIGLTLHSLDDILNGHLTPVVSALAENERNQKLIDAGSL
ncbi:MAG: peptide chain release factor 1 [Candidatus Omnitrophota bacterium]